MGRLSCDINTAAPKPKDQALTKRYFEEFMN